jgi:hypothetical protein
MNEVQFGTIYGLFSSPDQQFPGESFLVPHQQQFLARGTYQFAKAGQEILSGDWNPPDVNDALSGAVWAATRMFIEIQRRERRWNMAFGTMKDNIQALTSEVSGLKCEIQRLQQSRVYVVPLTTLAPGPLHMIQQIPVTVEGGGEDFTATFVEANVSASGETEADAIANFKDSLLSSYEVLEGLQPNQLGPLPARQWGVLQNVIKRTD